LRGSAPALGRVAVATALLTVLLAGCAAPEPIQGAPVSSVAPTTSSPSGTPTSASPAAAPGPVPSARVGGPAKSTRLHFIPAEVTLAGGVRAVVEPAPTVDGELEVPENVRHVGWWDGSAYVGDPFGTTVIAGHVDSATEGLGYFARLLRVEVGDEITVSDADHRLTYRVSSVQTVTKQALATESEAFDQTGDHRLVLITCAGEYRRDRGGYDSNLVVVATPVGLVR